MTHERFIMHNTAASSTITGNDTVPIARIDAQDDASIFPLREYLETHGVQVSVNRSPSEHIIYHIVMGEKDFVKEIYSKTKKLHEKRLAIIMGQSGNAFTLEENNSQIIFIDPKELSGTQVNQIFEFYFTSEKQVLDLRSEPHSRTVHETPRSVNDSERIGHMMNDIFGKGKKSSSSRKKKKRRWMIGVLIGFGIVIIPLCWYFLSIAISGAALVLEARSIAQGDTRVTRWQSRIAAYWMRQGSLVLDVASFPLTLIGQQELLRGQQRLVSFFSDAIDAGDTVQSLSGVGQSVAAGLLNQVSVGSSGTTPAATITSLQTSLDSMQNTLGLAQAELVLLLKDQTFPFSFPFVAKEGSKIVTELVSLRDSAATIDQLVSLFLQLAGFKEPRTYLILLQNSTELRPTGGFIGSVAVASFADGRMTDLEVQDVYTFDGQLKGHVDPPVPVRELLSQEHWYLRDSNWDPDFSVSAARAAWFYQKETGSSVDGVFAINTPFIVDVLKATGPIDLPDYNDRITADNFYGKSLYYTQNDFFPGSTQKKDFLGTLTRALITKVTASQTTNMTALFRAMAHALAGHDLLMMFGSADLQSVAAHFDWADVVPSTTGCIGVEVGTCRFDPLITVEANMGVNKANYFVTRTIDRTITIHTDESLSEMETITMKNASGQENGLPYQVYVRFLLPPDVSVDGVVFDGIPVSARKDTTTPVVLPYLERTDNTSFWYTIGVGVNIPAGTEKQLTISYSRGEAVRFGSTGAVVDLFVQKQAGVSGTPVHTIVQYPAAWMVGVEEQGDFIAKADQLEYNTILDRDSLTRIRFTK